MSFKSFVTTVAVATMPFAALANDSAANKAFVLEALQATLDRKSVV